MIKNKVILKSIHQYDIDLYLVLVHSKWTKANTNSNSSIYLQASK